MRRTNQFASNRNVIKNGAHALCEAESFVGEILENSGEIEVFAEDVLVGASFSGFSIVATDANGTEFGQSYTAQEYFDNFALTLDVAGGVSPYQVEFRAIPGTDCSCALIVQAEVATGQTVVIDQALSFSPNIVFGVETDTPGTFTSDVLGRSEEITIDRLSETIASDASVTRSIRIENTGGDTLFVYAQLVGGDVTASTLANTPVYSVPVGGTLILGDFVLDTTGTGTKDVGIILYTNSVGSKIKEITINYNVS